MPTGAAKPRPHRQLSAGAQRECAASDGAGFEFIRPDEIGRTTIGTDRGHEVTVGQGEASSRKKACAPLGALRRGPEKVRNRNVTTGAQGCVAPPEFKRIAVAVDGSPHANEALDAAIDLTRRYGGQLSIVAVAPLQPVYVGPTEPFVMAAGSVSDLPRYQQIVEESVHRAEQAGVSAVTGVCLDGVIPDELLGFLDQHPTDLLVIGSRGLSMARRILLGSVSTAMVTQAPCPVLVVRTPPTKRAP